MQQTHIHVFRLILWLAAGAMLLWLTVAGLPYNLLHLSLFWALQGLFLLATAKQQRYWLLLMLDMLLLTALFALSGGRANPFVSLYLLPVVIALLAQQERQALRVALTAVIGYSLLMLLPLDHGWHGRDHYWGMWANAMMTVLILLLFAGRLRRVMSKQDEALHTLREQQLRSEQVVAVAAQAALAAHQLATPLSVAQLTADELAEDNADPRLQELRRALQQSAGQVLAIRQAAEPQPAEAMALAAIMDDLLARFRMLHPATVVTAPALAQQQVNSDATLVPALLNLLDNAAQVSQQINLSCADGGSHWLLRIDDGGPGLGPELARRLGQPLPSDRHDGPGLGLFLAHASLERLGGFLRVRDGQLEVGLQKG